ncbi:MAG: AsmA family protein [Pseudomonadales bacterium]|nr:AsmA family protein [Pseudomonadales bacterium]
MNKLLKYLLIALSAVLLIGAGGILYLLNWDPNAHKDWIAGQFQQSTGRSLTLGGEIGLTLYPWLGVRVNDITVGNVDGFGPEPLFQAEHAEVRVKLLPLLQQQYEIDTVRLHGARINLTVNASGIGNWSNLTETVPLVDGETPPAAQSANNLSSQPLPLSNIILGGVDVRDAALHYNDLAQGVSYHITDLNFSTDALVYGQPIELNMSLQAAASRPMLSADMELTGTVSYDLDNEVYALAPLALKARVSGDTIPDGSTDIALDTALRLDLAADTLTLSDLVLTGPDTRLQASIDGQGVQSSSPAYRASMELSGADLALLFKMADIEPLASQLAALSDRSFALSGAATLDGDQLEIPQLQASLLGSTLEGNVLVSRLQSDSPLLRGNLNASGPDLPTVVDVLGQLSGGQNSPLSQVGRELRQVQDRSFRVSTQFDADPQAGSVNVPVLQARLFGTTLEGNVAATGLQSSTPQVRGRLNGSGPDLPLLLQIGGQLQGSDSSLAQYGRQLRTLRNREFTVAANFDANLQNDDIQVPELTFNGLGLELTGKLSARNMQSDNGLIDGALTLRGDNIRALLQAIDQGELAESVQGLSVQMNLSGSRSSLSAGPLQATLILSGPAIPNSPQQLVLRAGAQADLDRETLVVDNFSIAGLGLNANGKLNVSNLLGEPEYNGQISIPEFNLRTLLRQLNQEIPATADPRVLEQIGLSASFSGAPNSVAVSDLQLHLDDTLIQGRAAITDLNRQALSFDLAIDQLNADRYLAASTSASTSAGAGTSGPANAQASAIPVQTLRNLVLDGNLSVGNLTLSGLHFADLNLTATADAGLIRLEPVSTRLYEGSFAGALSLNAGTAVPTAAVNGRLQQVHLEPLLQDLLSSAYLSGQGNVELALTTSGADPQIMKRNLSGSGSIALENGILHGVDVGTVLTQVETMLRSRRVMDVQRGQQTTFDTFNANLAIEGGVIRSNDLLIKSPGFQVSGRGTLLNLNDETIGFDLVTSVDRSTATRDDQDYDIGGYSVPIACTGAMSAPRCLPDTREIVRTALQQEVQRRVGGLIERALGVEEPAQQPAADTADTTDETAAETQPNQSQQPVTPQDVGRQLLNRALDRLR